MNEELFYSIYLALEPTENTEQRRRDALNLANAIEKMIDEKIAKMQSKELTND